MQKAWFDCIEMNRKSTLEYLILFDFSYLSPFIFPYFGLFRNNLVKKQKVQEEIIVTILDLE